MALKTAIYWSVLMLLVSMMVLLMAGCESMIPALQEGGEATREAGEVLVGVGENSPVLNGLTGGILPLAGELLVILGAAGYAIGRKLDDAKTRDALDEVDENPQTPKLADQAQTPKLRKHLRKKVR